MGLCTQLQFRHKLPVKTSHMLSTSRACHLFAKSFSDIQPAANTLESWPTDGFCGDVDKWKNQES